MTGVDYSIREASEADFPLIAALFSNHNRGLKKEDWLRWKYSQNPEGPTRMYVAVDSGGSAVGFQGFIPRRISNSQDGSFAVMHNVDVFVAAEQRKKGLYSAMAHHSMTNLIAPRISFPNELSLGFSIRDGFQIVGPFKEWLFPLRCGESVKKTSMRSVAPLLNFLFRLYDFLWLGRPPSDIQMKGIKRFTRDFQLATDRMHGLRTASYLNWRFIDNPEREYLAYAFFEGGVEIGYCVYTDGGSSARIFDFLTESGKRACFRLLVDHCRQKGFDYISFPGIGLRMGKFGCFPRTLRDKFTVYGVPKGPWMITLCDRDV